MKKERKFFICDFETTGLDSTKDYPIEIGCLILDNKYNIVDYVDSLIFDPNWDLFNEKFEWKSEYTSAFKVHKILPSELKLGKTPKEICNILNKKITPGSIIISDCISFELNFMKRLYSLANMEYPFHYIGWDTNIILEGLSNIGDPKSKHRAIDDCFLLYKQIIRFAERIRFFKDNEEEE